MTTVKLPKPIKDGETIIKEVELKEPNAGNLRGLKMADILQLDVDAMMVLIPRISNLTEKQMLNMNIQNFTPLFTEVLGFFVEMEEA